MYGRTAVLVSLCSVVSMGCPQEPVSTVTDMGDDVAADVGNDVSAEIATDAGDASPDTQGDIAPDAGDDAAQDGVADGQADAVPDDGPDTADVADVPSTDAAGDVASDATEDVAPDQGPEVADAGGDEALDAAADAGPLDCALASTDDVFVIEAESLPLVDDWAVGTDGAITYIEWTGNQSLNNPGNGLLSVQLAVTTPGRYVLEAYVRVGFGNSPTDHNDTWFTFPDADDSYGMKMVGGSEHRRYPKPACDDQPFIDAILGLPEVTEAQCAEGATSGGWFKVYCSGALNWKWSAFTNDNDGFPVHAEFTSAGTYTVQLSARSSFHQIDRIVLRHEDVPANQAKDLALPASVCTP